MLFVVVVGHVVDVPPYCWGKLGLAASGFPYSNLGVVVELVNAQSRGALSPKRACGVNAESWRNPNEHRVGDRLDVEVFRNGLVGLANVVESGAVV